jgi:hypothetical protein
MTSQFTSTYWYTQVCACTFQFIPYITISYHLVLSCSVWYCQVLPCTLLGTSCLNFVLFQYQAVPSTSLESCTPEQTCTKLNQTEQSLCTGPFRYTGFKRERGPTIACVKAAAWGMLWFFFVTDGAGSNLFLANLFRVLAANLACF